MTPDKPEEANGEAEQRTPEEIRADIEATSEELGDTAAALADKADVKGQAKAENARLAHHFQQLRDGDGAGQFAPAALLQTGKRLVRLDQAVVCVGSRARQNGPF